MKEILFNKQENDLICECLQNEVESLSMGFYGQDMEITKRNDKREKECKRLIKKLKNAQKTIKVSSRKGKGRGLQYWVCEKIAGMFGIKFVQSDDDCLVQSRPMGQHSVDIILRGELKKKFPFDIECKACESLSIPQWVRQARQNNKKGRDWLVIFKKQTIGGEPLVVMEWATFEKIIMKENKNERN